MDDVEATYGLVMPFVVVRSTGGEYDDQGFAAGYQCGLIDAELTTCAATPQGMLATPAPRYVPKGLIAQLDLIAMRHGYTVVPGDEPDEAPGWVWIQFTPAEPLGAS